MKKYIILVLFALICQQSMAQHVNSFPFSDNLKNMIVRQQASMKRVIYLESGNNHYFVTMDDYISIKRVCLPQELDIHDFFIFNDYAYFCGANTVIRKGIVGYFHIDSLFRGISNLYIHDDFETNTAIVKSFDAITVYLGGLRQQQCIAAVGVTSNGKACAMEIVKTLPSWRYTIGESSNSTETITNICHTDRYVVTAGTIYNNVNGISFRIYTKGMMFSTSGYQNNIHKYTSNGNSMDILYPIEKFKMTAIDSNRVAVLSQWTTSEIPSNLSRGFLTLVVDPYISISTMECNQIYSILTNLEGERNRQSVKSLSFCDPNNSLTFLIESNSPWGQQSFHGKMTIPPTPTTSIGFYPNYHYTAMDNYHTLPYMTLIGYLRQQPSRFIYSERGFPLDGSCHYVETLPQELNYTFSKKTDNVEFNTYSNLMNFTETEAISYTASQGSVVCW